MKEDSGSKNNAVRMGLEGGSKTNEGNKRLGGGPPRLASTTAAPEARRFASTQPRLLGALKVGAFRRVNANAVAFLDERRHLHGDAGFKLRRLRAVRRRRAFHFGRRFDDRQRDRRRQLDAAGRAVKE